MMFRGDQHVDDWAEVAVDYLDGQLDQQTRMAVERHLAGCPDCAARLRKQQSVVRFLQETVLDDPPEDLEYRAIGELVFPSPGGRPLAQPVEVEKPSRSPRWYRTLRAWMPVTVAVIALLAAVIGYGVAPFRLGRRGGHQYRPGRWRPHHCGGERDHGRALPGRGHRVRSRGYHDHRRGRDDDHRGGGRAARYRAGPSHIRSH